MSNKNMKNENTNATEPNYTLRIIIGSALFYLVSKLYQSYGELKGTERTVGLVFMIFFLIVSIVILVTSIYGWYKASKKRKNKNLEDNAIENDDNSQDD